MSKFVQEMEPVAVPKHEERRFGRAAGSKCTLSISWRCLSVSVIAVAKAIHSCRLPLDTAKQVCDSNGHDLVSLNKLMREAKIDAGSLLVDCVSAAIVCLAHGRRRSVGKSP